MGKSGSSKRQQGRRGGADGEGLQRLRQEIAQLAARMLADGEADDLGSAKRRAAEALGCFDMRELPDNLTVLGEIVAYQRLFDAAGSSARLRALRNTALEAMRALREFEPRLVGPVLYGTAFDHTPVTLHVFSDEPEAVIRHLLQLRVRFQVEECALRVGKHATETATLLATVLKETDVELVVMSRQRLVHAPISPVDGAPYRRLDETGLAALLASPGADAPLPEFDAPAFRG